MGDFTQVVREGGLGPCGPPGLLCLSLCNERCARTLSVRSCRARRRQQWYGWFCWLRCTSRCVLRCNTRCSLCSRDRYAQCKRATSCLDKDVDLPVVVLDRCPVLRSAVFPVFSRVHKLRRGLRTQQFVVPGFAGMRGVIGSWRR